MILRRITRNVREQNWLAVGLDFFIVVIGVFVGLQVQQWAEEQRQVRLEGAYTQRLHDEVVNLLETRAPLIELRTRWGDALLTATPALFDPDMRELSELECQSIAMSYIVSNPTDELAALLELQSTGQISLFRNSPVASALGAFLLTRARIRDAHEASSQGAVNLPSKYPDLIQVFKPSDYSTTQWRFPVYHCDHQGMRDSTGFLNDFEMNQMIYAAHVRNNARVNEGLGELLRVLDEESGPSAGVQGQ